LQEQISAEATNAREPGAVGPDALELDAMELDTRGPDALEPYVGPEVLYRNLLVWAPLSWPLIFEP
jgi:hypothetical protein